MSRLPSLARVEKVLGEPAKKWAGRCYEIACACVAAKLVPGVAVYGHFLGKVAPKSYFGERAHLPFVQHGWVLLPDGRIWDPTRWSFEGPKPYIHVGENKGEYDEGGNKLRAAVVRPPPEWDPSEPKTEFTSAILNSAAWCLIEDLLKLEEQYTFDDQDLDAQQPGFLCRTQLFWIANLPYETLQPHAAAIYEAYKRTDLEGLIPIDNLRRAERESKRSA